MRDQQTAQREEKPAANAPKKRPSRADSPVWQRVEAIGQTYLRISRQIAHLVSATRQRKG